MSSPTTTASENGDKIKAPESREIVTERRLTKLETQMGIVKWVGGGIGFGLIAYGTQWLLKKIFPTQSLQTTLEWSKSLKDLISKL